MVTFAKIILWGDDLLTNKNVIRSIKDYVDALEVKVIFSEPTKFNPVDYPQLEQMGKWTHDKIKNTLTLSAKHLTDYKEGDLVRALSDSRVDPNKYVIKFLPLKMSV